MNHNILNTQNKLIEITALNGSLIYINKSINKQETIDLTAFAKGVYFVKVTDTETVKVKKIIKE